jgi:predicted metalloprotease
VVLKETEDVWNPIFQQQLGRKYQEPILVLFDGSVRSACGAASSATGPFYCPGDNKLYIDLSFYRELSQKFGAPGDFAMAYVVAHEVAHHVQNLLGITSQVQSQNGRISQTAYNDLSVRLELQADFLSGVWARNVQQKGLLEEGDIEEALRCAHAIGDDRIQKQARGYVVPDSFTHGTSEQRMRWFKKGFMTGDINQGDTFNTRDL